MARDVTECDDEGTARRPVERADSDGNTVLLDRREYLTLAGAGAVAAAAIGTASADEYDVIEARGQTIRIGSGETWENKLIDMTTGGDIVIVAHGTNWTIRNVGFRGKNTSGVGSATFGISDQGDGTSTFENVYLGDGSDGRNGNGRGHGQTAVWVNPKHSGHIDIRRCNIQGFRDNAIYASAPGNGGRGTVHIDECYAANCYVSHYRLGSPGSKVTNSVVKCDGDGWNGRGVWAWPAGGIEVDGCVFEMNGRHYSFVSRDGAAISVSNTDYDTGFNGGTTGSGIGFANGNSTNPVATIPDGVPESAAEAASGEASANESSAAGGETTGETDANASDSLDRTLLVDGVGTDGGSQYEFTVTGGVEAATPEGESIDDVIDGNTVTGTVGGWRDAFRFGGELEELAIDGDARVSIDGERVDPTEYGAEYPHVVTLVGKGVPSSFALSVDGAFETPDDRSLEGATAVSETTIEGSIERGVARFRFVGDLADVTFVDGDAHVYLDRARIDPDEYDAPRLPHAIVIDGTDADGPSSYSFTVDGAVTKSVRAGASIDDDDVVDGGTVRGVVDGWLDAFWFGGEVTDFNLRGDATVDVEYNARE